MLQNLANPLSSIFQKSLYLLLMRRYRHELKPRSAMALSPNVRCKMGPTPHYLDCPDWTYLGKKETKAFFGDIRREVALLTFSLPASTSPCIRRRTTKRLVDCFCEITSVNGFNPSTRSAAPLLDLSDAHRSYLPRLILQTDQHHIETRQGAGLQTCESRN